MNFKIVSLPILTPGQLMTLSQILNRIQLLLYRDRVYSNRVGTSFLEGLSEYEAASTARDIYVKVLFEQGDDRPTPIEINRAVRGLTKLLVQMENRLDDAIQRAMAETDDADHIAVDANRTDIVQFVEGGIGGLGDETLAAVFQAVSRSIAQRYSPGLQTTAVREFYHGGHLVVKDGGELYRTLVTILGKENRISRPTSTTPPKSSHYPPSLYDTSLETVYDDSLETHTCQMGYNFPSSAFLEKGHLLFGIVPPKLDGSNTELAGSTFLQTEEWGIEHGGGKGALITLLHVGGWLRKKAFGQNTGMLGTSIRIEEAGQEVVSDVDIDSVDVTQPGRLLLERPHFFLPRYYAEVEFGDGETTTLFFNTMSPIQEDRDRPFRVFAEELSRQTAQAPVITVQLDDSSDNGVSDSSDSGYEGSDSDQAPYVRQLDEERLYLWKESEPGSKKLVYIVPPRLEEVVPAEVLEAARGDDSWASDSSDDGQLWPGYVYPGNHKLVDPESGITALLFVLVIEDKRLAAQLRSAMTQ